NTHFVFDSEKSNVHNKLLRQIQEGVKLKRVVTNDRSKPVLDGLHKFRRQLTMDEQILNAEETSSGTHSQDDMDDIDAVRDDLQSTKQMLALELKIKENLEKENIELKEELSNLRMSTKHLTTKDDTSVRMRELESSRLSLSNELENAKREREYFKRMSEALNREKDELDERIRKMEAIHLSLGKSSEA
ncbi:hypothetical protein QAD02_014036, partial [Eretmocerus hayati]